MYYPKDFAAVFLASGITAEDFRHRHHQGKSLKTHLNYCRSHDTYQAGSKNELLHAEVAAKAEARAGIRGKTK